VISDLADFILISQQVYLLGNVWEWTNTWFAGYDGFQSFPYVGYSQTYFDQQHRVLKGGSWASCHWVLRPSFRNWYQPGVRQIFAGFRCAKSGKIDSKI
jgi:formylglycine-generating enzyme required for sulfatase activity